MDALKTPVRRFCKDILRQYPLMKLELEALEEERQAIAEAIPVATWQEPVRVKVIGDRTATQAFKLLRLEEAWSKPAVSHSFRKRRANPRVGQEPSAIGHVVVTWSAVLLFTIRC